MENMDEMLKKIEADTARDELRQLLAEGLKYAYIIHTDGRACIVIENCADLFPLDTTGTDNANLPRMVKEGNERLGLTNEDVKRIEASSIAVDMETSFGSDDKEGGQA